MDKKKQYLLEMILLIEGYFYAFLCLTFILATQLAIYHDKIWHYIAWALIFGIAAAICFLIQHNEEEKRTNKKD